MTAREIDHRIAAIAAGQLNRFSRAQAFACGADDAFIRRRLRSGVWVRIFPGVYGFLGADLGERQRLWESHLATGERSVVAFESAGLVHHLTGYPRGGPVLLAPHGSHQRLPGVRVHQIDDVTPEHVVRIDGLPVTGVARTIVDGAAIIRSLRRLGFVIDDAVAARKTTYAEVGACLCEVARRGKPGVRKLTLVLDERGPGHVPPASELERLMLDALDAGGLPRPIRQMPFPGRQFTAGCTDAGYHDARLILEADGRRWHTRIQDLKRDHDRDNEAARHGYQTLRFVVEHLRDDPIGVAATVREVRATRLRQLEEIAVGNRQL